MEKLINKKIDTKKANRNSSIELLRIVSMFMIIAHHYALYNKCQYIDNVANYIVVDIFSSFGKLGVGLFMIISGYYCNKTNFKMKKVFELLLQVWLYSVISLMIGIITNSNLINLNNIYKSIFPNITGLYWFSTSYIIIYLFSPYCKKLMETLNKKEYKIFLTIMISIYCFIGMIPKAQTFSNEFIYCVLIFFIGGYISKYNVKFLNDMKYNIFSIGLIVQLLIMICFRILGMKFIILNKCVRYFNSLNSPLILILIISLFLIFKDLKINKNNLINSISKTVFGIYLIHENLFLRNIIWEKLTGNIVISNPIFLVVIGIICISIVFFTCMLVDMFFNKMIYSVFFKYIVSLYDKILKLSIVDKVKNKILGMYNEV